MKRAEILEDITASKEEWDEKTTAAGHAMEWELDRQYLTWYGTCTNCGATMSIFHGGTSVGRGFQDARHVPCRGPGTAWQDEMQYDLAMERVADAVSQFGQDVKDVYDREWLDSQGLDT